MDFSNRTWPAWVPHFVWLRHECPRCNSIKFKPAERRPVDGLLAMVALRPVRCMFCWRRYYWFALQDATAQ
jgi:hypothetical protein